MGGPGPRLNPAGDGDAHVGAGDRRAVQLAVRAALPAGNGPLVVGVSGGPDSLALLAAAVHVAVGSGQRVHAVTVDHGWRHDSPAVAARVARAALRLGADDVRVVRVQPLRAATGGWVGGPEDAARQSRLAALAGAASRDGAAVVLLGQTLDDQAEQVLLGLARGSGARALAGMPGVRGPFRRPLLGLRREVVAQACPVLPDLGLPWHDPGNDDPAYLRARTRADLLPVLADVLGPGAVPSLARSADLLRADADALDDWAAREAGSLLRGPEGDEVDGSDGDGDHLEGGAVDVPVAPLAALPEAVRTRVLRLLARAAGSGPLGRAHTTALDALVVAWHGQGPVALPGGVSARRAAGPDGCGRLRIAAGRTPREDPHGRP